MIWSDTKVSTRMKLLGISGKVDQFGSTIQVLVTKRSEADSVYEILRALGYKYVQVSFMYSLNRYLVDGLEYTATGQFVGPRFALASQESLT